MKVFSELFGNKSNRKIMFTFLGLTCIFLTSAFIIGIPENPPGLVLFFLGVTSFILAFVHYWRKREQYVILLLASGIGFPVFVILHNLCYGLGKRSADIIALSQIFEFLHVLFFLIAIFICPPGILIGAVGGIVMYFKNKDKE